jgi:hypothetical protein
MFFKISLDLGILVHDGHAPRSKKLHKSHTSAMGKAFDARGPGFVDIFWLSCGKIDLGFLRSSSGTVKQTVSLRRLLSLQVE